MKSLVGGLRGSDVAYIRMEQRFTDKPIYLVNFVEFDERGSNKYTIVRCEGKSLVKIILEMESLESQCSLLNFTVDENEQLLVDPLLYTVKPGYNVGDIKTSVYTVEEQYTIMDVIRQASLTNSKLRIGMRDKVVEVNAVDVKFSGSTFNVYVPYVKEGVWSSSKVLWFVNDLYRADTLTVVSNSPDNKLLKEMSLNVVEREGHTEYEIDMDRFRQMSLSVDDLGVVYSNDLMMYYLINREGLKRYLTALEEAIVFMDIVNDSLGEVTGETDKIISKTSSSRIISDINLSIMFKAEEFNSLKYLTTKLLDDASFMKLVKRYEIEASTVTLSKMFIKVKEHLGNTPICIAQARGFIDGINCFDLGEFKIDTFKEYVLSVKKEIIRYEVDINKLKLGMLAYRYDLGDLRDSNEIVDFEMKYNMKIIKKGFDK